MKRFFESLFAPNSQLPRWWIALVAFALLAAAACFWETAARHGDLLNRDRELNDQMVYINMGANLKDTHYSYTVPRTRMPLYAVYVSLFHDGGRSDEEAFFVARRANIALSLACVAVLAIGFRFWLGWGLALMAALLSGFTWFVEKASYVQPEVLLATIIGLTCATLAELMRKPVWWKAAIAGVLMAAWHMTKASGPAILTIFFFAWLVKLAWPGQTPRRPLLVSGGVLLVAFLLPILPYLVTSWRVFGSPFYNTQSKFFVWCENDEQKHAVQDLDIHRRRPTEEELASLPSAGKYFSRHSLEDIRVRLSKGYDGMMWRVGKQHPELMLAMKLSAVLLLASALVWRRRAWQLLCERPTELLFVCSVAGGFATLFAWMHEMKTGPRMIASIHLVPLFFCTMWTREIQCGATIRVGGMVLSVERLVIGCVMLPVAVWLAWRVITGGLHSYMGA